MHLGKRIQTARRLVDLSSDDLAELLGVLPCSVRRLEAGTRIPSILTLRAIAEHCDTTVSYLLGEEGYDEPFRRFTGAIPVRTVDPETREPKKK